jgi:hypothetical protein
MKIDLNENDLILLKRLDKGVVGHSKIYQDAIACNPGLNLKSI